jgi:predicted MarR family transcription regulator
VSSSHLVSVRSPELSEFEFGLNTAYNAYSRWVVRCMGAAGVRDLTFLDVLVLHHVNHRGRAKRLADICFVLNVEDTHLVTYALKSSWGWDWWPGSGLARRPLTPPRRPVPTPAPGTARSASSA